MPFDLQDATADQLREALTHAAYRAHRMPHVVGNDKLPTPWDKAHADIDGMLDVLEAWT